MASQDLINAINELSKGEESKDKIKEILISEGWQEQAIESAFAEMKPEGPSIWQQLPTYPYFVALDEKTAELPPKVIWIISSLLILLVVGIIALVYTTMDPFALRGAARDQERESVYSQLKIALNRYHDQNNHYPASLTEMVPNFIKYVPLDPRTKNSYDYGILDNGANYNLCIYFETKPSSQGCLNTEVINARKMGIPVPTAEPGQ